MDARDAGARHRGARALQAYFEWLPIRLVDPADPQRIWRQFTFGDLVDLLMLDTRLYGRDEQLPQAVAGQVNDPDRQLFGDRQQDWLAARLVESAARWKLLGQQVMFGQLRLLTLPELDLLGTELTNELLAINPDQGDGYVNDIVYSTCKSGNRVWAYDAARQTIELIYDAHGGEDAPLLGVDNCVVYDPTRDLVVAEDGGRMRISAIAPDGTVAPILQIVGQDNSEITGPAFSPDGTRLYFGSQRGGRLATR